MKKYTALEIRGDDWLRGKDFVLASEYVLLEKERDILEQQCIGLGNVQAERDTLRTRVAKLEKVLRGRKLNHDSARIPEPATGSDNMDQNLKHRLSSLANPNADYYRPDETVLAKDALAEIDRLERERDGLRKALESIAAHNHGEKDELGNVIILQTSCPACTPTTTARAALRSPVTTGGE